MNTKKQTYITSAIFMVIIILIIIGGVFPLIKEIKKNYSSLISQKRELLLLKIKAENLVKFQEHYLIFHKNLDKIDEVFIDPDTPIDFLEFLESIAQFSQIPIEVSIGPLKDKKTDVWPSLSFQIFLNGPSSKIFPFLEKIENSPYLSEIEGLDIKRLSKEDIKAKEFEGFSPGNLKVSLLAKVYTK